MKRQLMVKTASLTVAAALLVNCSARDIVQESNPYLDPKPVTEVTVTRGIDPMAKDQWNLTKVGSNPSSVGQEGSRRIKVALLSTGVDYTHEDLASNIWVNRAEWKTLTPGAQSPNDLKDDDANNYADDFIGYDFVENDGLPFDRNGAGTAMAGVLGAATGNSTGIRGIVSDISIVPVRFVDGSGHMLLPNLFKSLRYALDQKVDLILLHTPSYEFGSTADPRTRTMVAQMEREMLDNTLTAIQKAGIPIVASAGNGGGVVEGSQSLTVALSKYSNIIVVTSVDQTDVRPFIANFSRERVHTTAPGKDVLTTAPGNKYQKVNSTSVAAAHVAGALALAINQTYGRTEPRKLVEAFLKPEASDTVERLSMETIGGNRLNITKYLAYLGAK